MKVKSFGFLAVVAGMSLSLLSCENDERMKTTPEETKILQDSSNAGNLGKNESREQVLKEFMGIAWQQKEGDVGAVIKGKLQENQVTVLKEESSGGKTQYNIQGGSFKGIPIQSGVIISENGKGLNEAILTLKPTGADLEAEFQKLITAITGEYGPSHEKTESGVNWYLNGEDKAVLDCTKDIQAKTLRVHARRGESGAMNNDANR
ncbi:MAG: hypothetical protein V4642_03700 [Bacteroidota bacterium]